MYIADIKFGIISPLNSPCVLSAQLSSNLLLIYVRSAAPTSSQRPEITRILMPRPIIKRPPFSITRQVRHVIFQPHATCSALQRRGLRAVVAFFPLRAMDEGESCRVRYLRGRVIPGYFQENTAFPNLFCTEDADQYIMISMGLRSVRQPCRFSY